MLTDERRNEFEAVTACIAAWARARLDISAVAIVGSWARDEANRDSDVDVVVLTDDTAAYVDDWDWVRNAVKAPAEHVRTQNWRMLTERRVRLASGLEIEFGFVAPTWADTSPVDDGTHRVVRDGLTALIDRDGQLNRLTRAIVSE